MKAIEILNSINRRMCTDSISGKLDLVIKELEELQSRTCDNCRHLETREKNLKFECLIEVCRTCTRNNNDNWEAKNEK